MFKKVLNFFLISFLILFGLNSLNVLKGEQKPCWTWVNAYGGKYADKSGTMVITDDEGYLIYGQTYGKARWDFFTMKIDKKGEILWSKIYSAPKRETAINYGNITKTNDGGFVFTNLSKSFGTGEDEDVVVVKLDRNGNIEWSKVLLFEGNQGVWGVIQTSDEGLLIGGSSYFKNEHNIYLIKLDLKGNWKWGRRLSYKDNWDAGAFLLEDRNGNYLVSGRNHKTYSNPLLIKVNSIGEIIWARIIDCGNSNNDGGDQIIEAIDGGYVVGGWTYSLGFGSEDFLVYKVNENGELSWLKSYGKEKKDGAVYISKTKNGYAIMGDTNSYRDGYDILYLNLDKNGNIVWSKRFGGDKDKEYEPRFGTIYETEDGGFVTNTFLNSFGNQGIELVVLKTNSEGDIENCPYIKDADIKVKDYTNKINIEKPLYTSIEFTWEIKDANFEVKDAGFTKTTIYEVKPSTLTLLAPNNGEVVKENLRFSWEESINSLTHEFQIAEYTNFNKIIFSKNIPDNYLDLPLDNFQNNKEYYWRVRGINSTHNGEWSNIFSFKVLKVMLPSKPENLKLEMIDDGVKLSWNFSNPGTFPIDGYEIKKSVNGVDFNIIGSVDKNTNYFIDKSIEINKTFYYLIRAFDNQIPRNYSENSNAVNIKIIDNKPPIINIYSPYDNYITNQKTITVKGNVIDRLSNIKELRVNNILVEIKPNGDFEKDISLTEGVNNLNIIAVDNSGNIAQKTLYITLDSLPPKIELYIPNETYDSYLEISGTISDQGYSGIKNDSILINGNLIKILNNRFNFSLTLKEGINDIRIEVEDNAGNKTIKTYQINHIKRIALKLQVGNKIMSINDSSVEIDVAPQIIEGRTYLPIRWIAEPLGAKLFWSSIEKKVSIVQNKITIELWIGKNLAKVNDTYKLIDPNNSKVVPLIINGRTMLPVRFVAENLGCNVQWDDKTKTVTIIYPR